MTILKRKLLISGLRKAQTVAPRFDNDEAIHEVFMKHNGQVLGLLAVLISFTAVPIIHGQTDQQQAAGPEAQRETDPIRQLNLTPEQREQIRSIREKSKTERAAINERVRDANRELEAALDSDNPDESAVEQRVREVAAAQAAAMRMRILTEIRIRRVLTTEQRNILRSLQQQARDVRRERLLNNREERQKLKAERSRSQQNQRHGLAPLFPRRQNPRRPRQ
jgi:Spy/CpxP family protein refolding chaperone